MSQAPLASPPSDAISSLTFAPNQPNILAVSSWDKTVRVYDAANPAGEGKEIASFDHQAPILECCFGENDTDIYSAGLNEQVTWLNPETNDRRVLGEHEGAVRNICYNRGTKTLVSGSWDCTIRTFDPRSPNAQTGVYKQPHKVYSMDTIDDKLVVAMASRAVYIYDLKNMSTPLQRRESSLKFMTRAVRCMPNGQGYASSSIEGRVAVEFFDPSEESQARKYAFKCHRQSEDGVDVVYPVNALAFHPTYGTFVSGGGDGVVAFWDAAAKRRLKIYPKQPTSVAALSFSNDGKYLAIGCSSGFEDGKEDSSDHVQVVIRTLGEGEGKPKAAKQAAA